MVSGFEALPVRTRREVIRLARLGKLHPDSVVRQKSLSWAKDVLDENDSRRRFAIGLVGDVLVGLMGAGGGASTGGYLANRRAAKRILSAAGELPRRAEG